MQKQLETNKLERTARSNAKKTIFIVLLQKNKTPKQSSVLGL
jgi:hypothetical protein